MSGKVAAVFFVSFLLQGLFPICTDFRRALILTSSKLVRTSTET